VKFHGRSELVFIIGLLTYYLCVPNMRSVIKCMKFSISRYCFIFSQAIGGSGDGGRLMRAIMVSFFFFNFILKSMIVLLFICAIAQNLQSFSVYDHLTYQGIYSSACSLSLSEKGLQGCQMKSQSQTSGELVLISNIEELSSICSSSSLQKLISYFN
jgi:hypothetical protein